MSVLKSELSASRAAELQRSESNNMLRSEIRELSHITDKKDADIGSANEKAQV